MSSHQQNWWLTDRVMPLLMHENAFGFLGVLSGAILGGLYFRVRSSNWPIDPTARQRRFGNATLSTLLLPALTVIFTGMRGQGFLMAIIALLIGLSIAIGILLSGDRCEGDVS